MDEEHHVQKLAFRLIRLALLFPGVSSSCCMFNIF
jgi:hypothetical protein